MTPIDRTHDTLKEGADEPNTMKRTYKDTVYEFDKHKYVKH
jgi:hypothetical protein